MSPIATLREQVESVLPWVTEEVVGEKMFYKVSSKQKLHKLIGIFKKHGLGHEIVHKGLRTGVIAHHTYGSKEHLKARNILAHV